MRLCNKDKNRLLILLLMLIVLCIGVGYAILTQQLTINNTVFYDSMKWDVGFTSAVDGFDAYVDYIMEEIENEGLVYTERTNGKFVTEDKKLIEKIKKELAKEKVNNYLNDMKNIGISYEEAVKYLQELGGNK